LAKVTVKTVTAEELFRQDDDPMDSVCGPECEHDHGH
jgi:hypothetical protein